MALLICACRATLKYTTSLNSDAGERAKVNIVNQMVIANEEKKSVIQCSGRTLRCYVR